MRHIESIIQRSCVTWFRYQYREYASLLFAVPNGGSRGKVEAALMKAEGTTPGVSDLILLVPRKGYASLCIEMKTPDGRQSAAQKSWQCDAEAAGNKYIVCRSFDEFRTQVDAYLKPRKVYMDPPKFE